MKIEKSGKPINGRTNIMRKIVLAVGIAAMLTGCASGPSSYQLYADTQAKIAQANAISDTARYNALLEIAKNGDSAAKVAAVLSIQMGQGSGAARPQQQVAPPEDWDTKLLKWAGVLLPSITQIYGINSQRQIAVTQSNNAAATAQSTNNTFATMSTNMATSNTNIAKAGFDAVSTANTAITNVANTGMTSVVSVANNGITGISNTAAAGLTATTNISNNAMTGMTNVSKNGMDSLVTVAKDSGTTITTLGSQSGSNISAVTTGYKSALDSAISKLTGTTTTTTSTTTTTTTTNNVACPAGQTFTGGVCKTN